MRAIKSSLIIFSAVLVVIIAFFRLLKRSLGATSVATTTGDIIVCVEISKTWWSGYVEVRNGKTLVEPGADPKDCDIGLFPPNFTNDTGGWRRPTPESLSRISADNQGCAACCGSSQRKLRKSARGEDRLSS